MGVHLNRIELYSWWYGRSFRRNGAVGYYFWEEFNKLREKSQRYHDPEHYKGANEAETTSYDALFKLYDGDHLLSPDSDSEGWGHLSWRGQYHFL